MCRYPIQFSTFNTKIEIHNNRYHVICILSTYFITFNILYFLQQTHNNWLFNNFHWSNFNVGILWTFRYTFLTKLIIDMTFQTKLTIGLSGKWKSLEGAENAFLNSFHIPELHITSKYRCLMPTQHLTGVSKYSK